MIEQLCAFFRPRFEYWARQPEFSPDALWQVFEFVTLGGDTGEQAARFRARRSERAAKLCERVLRKRALRRLAIRAIALDASAWGGKARPAKR